MTGVIGAFIVIACAATLHPANQKVNDARDAAEALQPLAGSLASTVFALGLLGAALLADAVVPLSTAYSVSEAFGQEAALDDSLAEAPFFYAPSSASRRSVRPWFSCPASSSSRC